LRIYLSRRLAEGSATAVPDDALGNRRRYIFVMLILFA
jgi:hypothetical protein